MNRPGVLVATLATVATLASPGSSDSGDWRGIGCSFASVPDTQGVHFGALEGGPWISADFQNDPSPGGSHQAIDEITMHCWIQLTADQDHALAEQFSHCHFEGIGVAIGACLIAFLPDEEIYLCASVEMFHSDPFDPTDSTYVNHQIDRDPVTPGIQCALAVQ